MKIVYLDSYALNPGDIDFTKLEEFEDIKIYPRTITKNEVIERIGDAEVVIVNKVVLDNEIYDACPNIRLITVTATGYNTVDVKGAREHGITVCNVPLYSTPSVAQHIFALLLELAMHTGEHSVSVNRGDWAKCPDYTYHVTDLTELSGKTMGFIGMGAIGSMAARIAQAFGMRAVCYHSRSEVDGVDHLELDELLEISDIVALCCPLTEDNKKIIRRETIEKMRDGVIIINTSRGGLIDENDLAEAVKSGKVAGVGVDVLENEPPKNSSPLVGLKNVIITPHIAWAPKESRERLLNVTIANVKGYMTGNIQNKVN